MRLKRGCAVAMLALAVQGCAERAADRLSGDYRLLGSVNTRLPLLLQYEGECAINLDSGLLTFRDSIYDSAFRIVRRCPAMKDSIMPDPGARSGRYELRGDTLTFQSATGDFAGIGIRKGDTLTITGIQHTLIYARD